jgi:hypothetical protein
VFVSLSKSNQLARVISSPGKYVTSISICSSLLLLNIANVSRLTYACFNNLKVLLCSVPYLNSVSFCVSLVSSKAFLE